MIFKGVERPLPPNLVKHNGQFFEKAIVERLPPKVGRVIVVMGDNGEYLQRFSRSSIGDFAFNGNQENCITKMTRKR